MNDMVIPTYRHMFLQAHQTEYILVQNIHTNFVYIELSEKILFKNCILFGDEVNCGIGNGFVDARYAKDIKSKPYGIWRIERQKQKAEGI